MNDNDTPDNTPPKVIIYEAEGAIAKISVRLDGETVWLTQQQLAALYGTSRPNVTMHIRNILSEGELLEETVCKKFLHTAVDGKNYEVMFYNLDMIISLGYRNKIHYAVHGQTAAEVIYNRVDAEKEFMGLLSFIGSRPHLADTMIAKNYLNADELRALGQIVGGYLDFAERQAERHAPMTMRDWATHLDKILTATGERLLADAGKISHEKAVDKARTEYVKYQARTLSEAEKQYLASLRNTENILKKRKEENL